MVLISDPRVVGVPVRESTEPMVDLGRIPRLRIDPRKADETGGWHHARAGLAERLADAADALPAGLELLIVEAFRSPARQRGYWDGYRADLHAHYPGLTESRLYRLASRWVAPPEVAPHCTGGAIDLTRPDADGPELDLGSPLDATPEQSSGACFTAAAVPRAASANRALLVGALSRVGLVNYPTEWWHWSYGERYWAFGTGAGFARYGPVEFARPDFLNE